jgi:predicted ATPase
VLLSQTTCDLIKRALPPDVTVRELGQYRLKDLLQPERIFLRRMAVFVGGCTLETAGADCAVPEGATALALDIFDGLTALVEQSLVQQREESGEPRFGLLRVIREYALEQLEASGEAEALQRAQAAHYLALAERAEPEMTGSAAGVWLEQLEREHDNLRAALGWARERSAETGMGLVAALWRFWWTRGARTRRVGVGRGEAGVGACTLGNR